jgi:hypothetical protein
MRKRLVLAAFCILAVPALFSPSQNGKLIGPTPFPLVAIAGHTTVGGWCQCGTPGCACDPGEDPGGNSARPVTDNNESSDQGLSPIRTHSRSGFDFGPGTLRWALALFVWARLRA